MIELLFLSQQAVLIVFQAVLTCLSSQSCYYYQIPSLEQQQPLTSKISLSFLLSLKQIHILSLQQVLLLLLPLLHLDLPLLLVLSVVILVFSLLLHLLLVLLLLLLLLFLPARHFLHLLLLLSTQFLRLQTAVRIKNCSRYYKITINHYCCCSIFHKAKIS